MKFKCHERKRGITCVGGKVLATGRWGLNDGSEGVK